MIHRSGLRHSVLFSLLVGPLTFSALAQEEQPAAEPAEPAAVETQPSPESLRAKLRADAERRRKEREEARRRRMEARENEGGQPTDPIEEARRSARSRNLGANSAWPGVPYDVPPPVAVEGFVGPPTPDMDATAGRIDERAMVTESGAPGEGAEGARTRRATPVGEAVAQTPPDPDAPTEWFNFDGMAWEDVLEHFAERLGKPLRSTGEVMLVGELTYKSDRRMTPQEAIDELNFLLLEQDKYLVETDKHVFVVPTSELQKYLPLGKVYESLDAFEAANVRDMEYVIVYFDVRDVFSDTEIKDQSAEQLLEVITPAMPDYAIPTLDASRNKVKIAAMGKDVRRLTALLDHVKAARMDLRETRIFSIKTNANQIEEIIREVFELPSATPVRGRRPQPQPQPGPEQPALKIIADERTNSLIIHGKPAQLAEVEQLIREIDKRPDIGEFKTHVVEVRHGNASDIATLLNQIFSQEQGEQRATQVAQARNVRRQVNQPNNQQPNPQDIIVEDIFERAKKTIRLVAEDRTNTLIVYANDDGLKRVREMLEVIDKPVPSNFRTFVIQNATAKDVFGVVEQLARGMSGPAQPGRAARTPTLVLDEGANAVHVVADREHLDRIAAIIADLDVAGPEESQHVVHLANMKPSRMAELLRQLLNGDTAQPAAPRARGRRTPAQGAQSAGSAQLIPLDEAKLLVVVCTDEDWEKIRTTVATWDEAAVSDAMVTRRFTIEQANPESVANVLSTLYRQYTHPSLGRSNVVVHAEGQTVFVQGVQPAIDEIATLVDELDVPPTGAPLVILPLTHADAAEVLPLIQPLVQGSRSSRGAAPPDVQAEPLTNSIIVRAPRATVEEVKAFISEYESKLAGQAPERRFYTIRNTQPREVVTAIVNLYASQGTRTRGGGAASQVKAIESGAQVIVEAPPSRLPEIEDLIQKLDVPRGGEILNKVVKFERGTDVNAIAGRLSTVANEIRRTQPNLVAAFGPDPATRTILMTISRDLEAEVDRILSEYSSAAQEVAAENDDAPVTIALEYADPQQTAQMLNQMFGASRNDPRSRSAGVQVTVANNTLVVRAPEAEMERIRALVQQLDVEDTSGIQIRMYDLRVLNAGLVAGQVQMFLRGLGGVQRSGKMQPGAFAEPTTNTLIVMAPAEHLPMIETMIQQIEAKQPDTGEIRTYTLSNVRAEAIAQNVKAMLDAKVIEHEGTSRKGAVQTLVLADQSGGRLTVYAPERYQALAAELIEVLDSEVESGEIVRIIQLQQGDAAQTATVLTQMAQPGGPAGRGGQAAKVKIVADPGSNSLLISGLERDVERIARLVADLEETSDTAPELQVFKLKNIATIDAFDALTAIFPSGKTPADTVTITEDSYYNRLLVTANKRKLRHIAAVVEQLDQSPYDTSSGELASPDGRELYFVDVFRGDPTDIAWDVEEHFPPPDKGGPKIDAAWEGNYITVRCRPNEFPAIKKLIHEYDSRAKVTSKIVFRKLRGDAERMLSLLQQRQGDLVIDRTGAEPTAAPTLVEELWPEGQEPPVLQERRERDRQESRRGAPSPSSPISQSPAPRTSVAPMWLTLEMQDAIERNDAELAAAGVQPVTAPTADLKPDPPVIKRLPDGRVLIQGTEQQVDNLEEALDLLEEDLAVGEVIRIFKFKYGDVTAAAQILDRMFNDPASARLAQLQQAAQQNQQQPQQPQRGGRERGEGGGEGEGGARGGGGGPMEQILRMMGGGGGASGRGQQRSAASAGGTRVRMATEPGHNYLIVKCDESDLPEIRQLLRELDIPPGEVDVKVFQLRNVDAAETAANLKEVLGITKAQSRRENPFAGAMRGANPQQQQLMQVLQQQMVQLSSMGEEVGARIDSVEIVANSITNSLLISAPPEVMVIIENLIGELEDLEGRDVVVIRQYPLKEARVQDVLPLLQEIFTAVGKSTSKNPASLGPIAISGDPRSNTIVFTAEQKDVEIIEQHIARLDFSGALAEAETLQLDWGDAVQIAGVVQTIYGAGDRTARGPGAADAGGSQAVRIVAEPATNTIVVWGPREQRQTIFEKIQELDAIAKSAERLHEMPVINADAEKLAAKLNAVFGNRAVAAGAGAGRSGPASAGMDQRVVIMGDKAAKKLLVRAPDHILRQIEALVETLDVPSTQLQIHKFDLKHADAQAVVDSVKQAFQEFMLVARSTGTDADFDAFTAVADPRTNSVVVVGSPEMFVIVERLLDSVDVPVPEAQRKQFRIFVLDRADAETVANAINSFATGGAPQGDGSGRRPGQPGGAAATSPLLDVKAAADAATNSVMVFGRPDAIAEIESSVVARLDGADILNKEFETIYVKQARPSQVVSLISPFLATPETRGPGGRGASAGGAPRGPQLMPNDQAGKIIVYGSPSQVRQVRTLVEQFDNEDADSSIAVIEVPFGQDVRALAAEVERIVNEGERNLADARGVAARTIRIGSDEYSRKLFVYGDPALYGMVETLVNDLGAGGRNIITTTYRPRKISAEEAQRLINELQRGRGGSVRPAGGTGTSPGGRSVTPPSNVTPPSAPPRAPRMQPSPAETPRRDSNAPTTPDRRNRRNRPGTEPAPPGGAWRWTPPAEYGMLDRHVATPGVEFVAKPNAAVAGGPMILFAPILLDICAQIARVTVADAATVSPAVAIEPVAPVTNSVPAISNAEADNVAAKHASLAATAAPRASLRGDRQAGRITGSQGSAQRVVDLDAVLERLDDAAAAASTIARDSAAGGATVDGVGRGVEPSTGGESLRPAPASTPDAATQPASPRRRPSPGRRTPPFAQFEPFDTPEVSDGVGGPLVPSVELASARSEVPVARWPYTPPAMSDDESRAEVSGVVMTPVERADERSQSGVGANPYVGIVSADPDAVVLLPAEPSAYAADEPVVIESAPREITFNRRDDFQGDAAPSEPAVQPEVAPAVAESTLAAAEAQPEQPAEPTQPRPRRRAEAADHQAATAPSTAPTTQVGATGVSGSLRGDVYATAVEDQLIITGDEEDVEFILRMLEMMEADVAPGAIRVFQLQKSKATVIQPILERTLEALLQSEGATGPRDRVSIIAEARSNSLIVAASEANMDRVAGLIAQLDEQALEPTDFAVVPLQHLRASEAVRLIQPALERLQTIENVPTEARASISADDRSNTIVVVGNAAEIDDIRRLIEQIDIEITDQADQTPWSTAEVVVVELKNALAEELAETLTDLIEAQRSQGAAAAEGAPSGPMVRKLRLTLADGQKLPEINLDRPIRVLPEPGTNSLIIFSTPDNNKALTEVARTFDTPPVGAEVDVKSFALRHASATAVAEVLTNLFDEAKAALQRPAAGAEEFAKGVLPPVPPGRAASGLPYNVTVTHDERANTVIVVGRRDAVLLAAGIITELDKPAADLMQAYVIPLKNIAANALQEKLQTVLDARAQALSETPNDPRDNAVLMTDERSNALVVLASGETYQMISEIVRQLDQADSYRVVSTRFHVLKQADAVKLGSMLTELFDRKREVEGEINESKDSLHVIADDRSNSLVLTGTPDYLLEAERLISDLDRPFGPTVEMRIRSVRLNSASNIATHLTEMVEKVRTEGGEGSLRGTPIHIKADMVSNSVMIAGAREDVEMVERWVELLDKPSEVGRETRIIPLRVGNAETLSTTVGEMFKGAGGEGAAADLTVTFDPTTNAVIAIGPPALVREIESTLNRLDQVSPMGVHTVRIFQLSQTDAEDAGELIGNILEGRGGAVGGSSGGGGGEQTDEASRARMIQFESAHPGGKDFLRAMRSEISVTADVRTNSLVVTAPPDSMGLMEALVAAVDVPPRDAKIRVFALRNSDAENMVEMLRELFEEAEEGGAQSGTDGQAQVLTGLGAGSGSAFGGRQQVSFTTDLRTNSVIAAGTPGYLDLVEQLVLELDSKPIETRMLKPYMPRNIEATLMAETIKSFSDAEKARLEALGEEISSERVQEREIISVANEEANVVLLGFSPRMESEVLEIVRELDQAPAQVSIEVLIVEVTVDNALELGVEFAFQDLQFTKAGPNDTTTFDYVGGTDIGAAGSGLGGFTFTITGADFNFLLRTLQSESSLRVLSRPQIVAMNNREATFEVTNNIPFIASSTTNLTGQITTSVDRRDVGIRLGVTPNINPDGFVRLEIRQEVSDFSGSTIDLGGGVTSPIFFQRIAETVVTVKDNETVVLGGLILSRKETGEQKVPILGDVPLLGTLFRNQSDRDQRTELLIILTPRVIRTIEDYRNISVAARDSIGSVDEDVLTNPLMNGLRVPIEELHPELQPMSLESTAPARRSAPATPPAVPPPPPAEEPDRDIYGPPPRSRSSGDVPSENPDSYDIPLTRRTPR